jgi:hypothetical protein
MQSSDGSSGSFVRLGYFFLRNKMELAEGETLIAKRL